MSAKQDRQVVRNAADLERKYKLGKKAEAEEIRRIADIVYPVGSIYLAYSHINPATLFGGKWERLENAFLLAVDANGTIGETGGEKAHILTASEMPSHTHGFQYSQDNGASYKAASMGKDGSISADYYLAAGNSVAAFADYRVRIAPSGDGAAHNNMPPYIQISAWRRTA